MSVKDLVAQSKSTQTKTIQKCLVDVHISNFWPSNLSHFVQQSVNDGEELTDQTPWSYRVGLRLQQPGCHGGDGGIDVVVFGQEAENFFHHISPESVPSSSAHAHGKGVSELKKLLFHAMAKGKVVTVALSRLGKDRYEIVGTRMQMIGPNENNSSKLNGKNIAM